MAQKLLNAYVDPSQPGSLGGVAKFAKAHGLTQSKARQVLQTLLSCTLHKLRRRHFPTLPVMVFKVDQQWVMGHSHQKQNRCGDDASITDVMETS